MKTWQKLKSDNKLWQSYFIREKVLTGIRRFFLDRNFHEVETPYLTGTLPPESYLDVFETNLKTPRNKSVRAFLPTSPELFLKKLIAAGIGNCYSMPKSFRNTEVHNLTHNPEFTILEWYRVNADYTHIMRDCEELFIFINTCLQRSTSTTRASLNPAMLTYQGKNINLARPWERISVTEAFKKYAGMDLLVNLTKSQITETSRNKGYQVKKSNSWEELFHQIFLNEVEPNLGQGKPTIIYDYPIALAALSRKSPKDPRFAERFEIYIEGLELGDAYSELTDWREQLSRFKKEFKERRRLGRISHPIDMDFIDALKSGMPETGGISIGVDRLIMLFADVTDIAQTMFFPISDLFDL